MFDNLMLVIIIIVVLWLGLYSYYWFTSRQQKDIADQVEQLQRKLGEVEVEKENT
ncbi:MAG: YdgA family protein [Chloroflexi bacterium]|nr:YdgA family protein [Chloroflexota bacterium]